MASAAFKSSSRRGNATPENSNPSTKVPPQRRTRSLSVSAVSRTHLDIPSDFLIKRDNPLFSDEPENANGFSKTTGNVAAAAVNGALTSKASSAGGDRGRAVSRNADAGSKKAIGRSLSRVDLGRGRHRSVSRGRYVSGTSESEVEQEHVVGSKYRKTSNSNLASSNVKRPISGRNAADTLGRTRSLVSQSNCHPSVEPSNNLAVSSSDMEIPNWEDGISTGSLSEAEEKTIKAVCEQMKSFQGDHLGDDTGTTRIYETVRSEVRRAISDIQNDLESAIRRNNTTAIATADVADIPPDLVNPGAVELVLDIRREYARKLEESQERARKLRADLAVEEHRGQELSRILKETLPNPKTPTIQRSRLGRRISSERKKMSKRLTDEAMSYFDECVSISTFDSSDFSAPEDPSLNSVGATIAVGCTASLPQESTSVSASYGPKSCLNDKQESVDHGRLMHSREDSGLTANSSSNEPTIDQASRRGKNSDGGGKSQFSFGHKPTENVGLRQDIKSYIKKFEKDMDKNGINSVIVTSKYFEMDGYELQGRTESLLFDRVFLKNRIESGSLHICGGGIAISFSPFASVI